MNYWQNFQRAAYAIASTNGFHADDQNDNVYLRGLQLARRLLLVVCEVAEAFEEMRKGYEPTDIYFVDKKPEGVPIELADVVIRCAAIAECYGIDLGKAIDLKMAFNRTREYMHGGKLC